MCGDRIALVASLTAKKTAPAGMLDNNGTETPRYESRNNRGRDKGSVSFFCKRTVAVSRGNLMRVLETVKATPAIEPEIDSWSAELVVVMVDDAGGVIDLGGIDVVVLAVDCACAGDGVSSDVAVMTARDDRKEERVKDGSADGGWIAASWCIVGNIGGGARGD